MIEQNLDKLATLVGVIQHGSIRRFAMAHRMSQPTVSQRVSGLEKALGYELLIRSREGVRLTAKGKIVHGFGVRLLEESRILEQQLARSEERPVTLKFGTYDSIAIYLMPSVIEEMRKHCPKIRIQLVCDRSATIARMVRDGQLDVALCPIPISSAKLHVLPLYEDQYAFFESTACVVDSKNLLTLPDAVDQHGVMIRRQLKDFGLNALSVVGAPSFEVVKAMTIAGLGIGVMPIRVATQALRRGLVRRVRPGPKVPEQFGTHSFGLISTRVKAEQKEMKILSRIIRELAPRAEDESARPYAAQCTHYFHRLQNKI